MIKMLRIVSTLFLLSLMRSAHVEKIRGATFKQQVINTDDAWLIAVIDSDRCGVPCEKLVAAFDTVTRTLGHSPKLGTIEVMDSVLASDGESYVLHQFFNITDLPNMLFYSPGPKILEKPLILHGNASSIFTVRGAPGIFSILKSMMPTSVEMIKGNNIPSFIDGPLNNLPRLIMYTEKPELSLMAKTLSVMNSNRLVMGKLTTIDSFSLEFFNLQKSDVPTLMLSGAHPATHPSSSSWSKFPKSAASLNVDEIQEWIDSVLGKFPPVPLLTSPESFQSLCNENPAATVCFIALLPASSMPLRRVPQQSRLHVKLNFYEVPGNLSFAMQQALSKPLVAFREAAARSYVQVDYNSAVQMMVKNSVPAMRLPLTFAMLDSETQSNWLSTFDIPTSAPAIIALNGRKKVFAKYKDSFSADKIYEWVVEVMEAASPNPLFGSTGDILGVKPNENIADKIVRKSNIVFESLSGIPSVVNHVPDAILDKDVNELKKTINKKKKTEVKTASKEENKEFEL
jgi:hypothetical protein